MGSKNQFLYAEHVLKGTRGRILEVGSKNYGNTEPFRGLFPGQTYVGVDLAPGDGVDVVADLASGTGGLPHASFDLIIMCSVLEHCPKPWKLAENIQTLLAPGGALYSCHPWVWRYHKYPDDYFRFSPPAIKSLFDSLQYWTPPLYATYLTGEFYDFQADEGVDNNLAIFDAQGRKFLPYLETIMLGARDEAFIGRACARMQKRP